MRRRSVKPMSDPGLQAYLIVAAPLRDLNRALGLELPEGEGFSTLAGLILSLSGRIPEAGAKISAPDGSTMS